MGRWRRWLPGSSFKPFIIYISLHELWEPGFRENKIAMQGMGGNMRPMFDD